MLQRRARYDSKTVTELPAWRALLYTLLVSVTDSVNERKGAATGAVAAVARAAAHADPCIRCNSGSVDYCACWAVRAVKAGNIPTQVPVRTATAVTRAIEGPDRSARTVVWATLVGSCGGYWPI